MTSEKGMDQVRRVPDSRERGFRDDSELSA
jgi:hypothetical protein